jgi:hypothetical protein
MNPQVTGDSADPPMQRTWAGRHPNSGICAPRASDRTLAGRGAPSSTQRMTDSGPSSELSARAPASRSLRPTGGCRTRSSSWADRSLQGQPRQPPYGVRPSPSTPPNNAAERSSLPPTRHRRRRAAGRRFERFPSRRPPRRTQRSDQARPRALRLLRPWSRRRIRHSLTTGSSIQVAGHELRSRSYRFSSRHRDGRTHWHHSGRPPNLNMQEQ